MPKGVYKRKKLAQVARPSKPLTPKKFIEREIGSTIRSIEHYTKKLEILRGLLWQLEQGDG